MLYKHIFGFGLLIKLQHLTIQKNFNDSLGTYGLPEIPKPQKRY